MANKQKQYGKCRIAWTIPERCGKETMRFYSNSFKIGDTDECYVKVKNENDQSQKFRFRLCRTAAGDTKVRRAKFYLISNEDTRELHMEDKLLSEYCNRPVGDVSLVCDIYVSTKLTIPYIERWFEEGCFMEMGTARTLEIVEKLQKFNQFSYKPSNRNTIGLPSVNTAVENPIAEESSGSSSIFSNEILFRKSISNACKERMFCDIIIRVQSSGQDIQAHKVVLVSGSTIWKQMLSNDEHLSVITINDLDYQIVEAVVTFIYDGTAPAPQIATDQLLIAADTYGVAGLKDWGEKQLLSVITVDSLVNILMLAFRYNAPALLAGIVAFVRQNFAMIEKRDDWKAMFLTNPELAMKLFNKLL